MTRVNYEGKRYSDAIPLRIGLFPERINSSMKDKPIYYMERRGNDNVIFEGDPGQGKSILADIISVQVAQYRPVVYFDYKGEHINNKYPNFLSESNNTRSIPNLKYVKNFKFKVSQFNKVEDWMSLGMNLNASEICSTIAKRDDVHLDNPHTFKKMIDEIDAREPWKFQRKYSIELPPSIHSAILQSIQKQLYFIMRDDFFAEMEGRTWDFGQYVADNPHVVIDFDQEHSRDLWFRAKAGKAMEQIHSKRWLIKKKRGVLPLLVFEEADTLFPNVNISDGDNLISSLVWGIRFVLKLAKEGWSYFFLVQSMENLHWKIRREWKKMFLGPGYKEPYADSRKKLKWDISENYREFLVVNKGEQPPHTFVVPDDSPRVYW